MSLDNAVKLAVYKHFADTGRAPLAADIAKIVQSDRSDVLQAYSRLRGQRVLVLEPDGESIRMAPPFSGVETQHTVIAAGKQYFANCAWDALGIPAALHQPAEIHSRCEQSGEPLRLKVDLDGPEPCSWVFHCLVPAAKWWDDIVFT